MGDIQAIAGKIERAVIQSRLNELAVVLSTDRSERVARIVQSLLRLRQGAYLVGTGPSTVGVIPLTVDEVVLGRAATPLEEPTEVVVDYCVSDTIYLAPHEVSRAHAKILRRQMSDGIRFTAIDLVSSCGTYLNGELVKPDGDGCMLSHGDVLSLGPHQVSTYMFILKSSESGGADL